jgi:hypothetical protein
LRENESARSFNNFQSLINEQLGSFNNNRKPFSRETDDVR